MRSPMTSDDDAYEAADQSRMDASAEAAEREKAEADEEFPLAPECAKVCRYAEDVGMLEHSCGTKCMYLDRPKATP